MRLNFTYSNTDELKRMAKDYVEDLFDLGLAKDDISASAKALFMDAFLKEGINFDGVVGRHLRRIYPKTEDQCVPSKDPVVSYKVKATSPVKNDDIEEALPEKLQLEVFVPEDCDIPSATSRLLEAGYSDEDYDFLESRLLCRKFNGATGLLYRYYYKRKSFLINQKDMFDIIQRQIDLIDRPMISKITPLSSGSKLGVLQICDVHYGAFCTKDEHGIEWGAKECAEDIDFIVDKAIKVIKEQHLDKIIVTMTGDGMNSDTLDHTTSHGTPQNDCLSCIDMFEGYLNICSNVINRITKEGGVPVEFLHVVGNHDEKTGATLMAALRIAFQNNPNVVILNEKNFRKYRTFSKFLCMFTHGQQEGRRIKEIASREAPKEAANADYTVAFSEHTHQFKIVFDGNTIHCTGATIAPPATWTKQSGYVGGYRGAALYVFNEDDTDLVINYLGVKYQEIDSFVKDVNDLM